VITHLLDTDVCIYALKKRSRSLLQKLSSLEGHMAVSDVTLFELYFGAESYAEPEARVSIVEDFATRLEVLPFDSKAARHAGNIRAELERRGMKIGAYDIQIAAVARSQGLILATNNLREFARVKGLRIEKWA
jgi:tRNA(fMet)-specific endonuclease VapC